MEEKKAAAIARGKNEVDTVHMYVTLKNELSLGNLNREDSEFNQTYGSDFPAFNEAELLALRNSVKQSMKDHSTCTSYEKVFRKDSLENRILYGPLNYFNVPSANARATDYDLKAMEACETYNNFFTSEEMQTVRSRLQTAMKEMRDSMNSQIGAINPDWLEFKTVRKSIIPTLYTVDQASGYNPANSFHYKKGENIIILKLHDPQKNAAFVIPLMNEMCWLWRTSVRDIWIAAAENDIDDKRDYVGNNSVLRDAIKAAKTDDKLFPPHVMVEAFGINKAGASKNNQKAVVSPNKKRIAELQSEINSLRKESDTLHGFFSFFKKRKIQSQIDALQEELQLLQ